MASLQIAIPPQSSPALASYSFSDLANVSGVVTYYGAKDEDLWFLTSSNSVRSNRVMTLIQAQTDNTDTIQHDLDFDLEFNLPQTIKGEVQVATPVLLRNASGGTITTYNLYTKIYVRRVRNGVESDIASDTGETLQPLSVGNGVQYRANQSVSVTVPRTLYKKGDKLRITVEFHAWNTSSGSSDYAVGHDPANRPSDDYTDTAGAAYTFDTEPSTLIIQIPYRINN